MDWFWLFLFYGFLGYLLERMFAKVTASPQQVRKGFLLLPVCPVYGTAMVLFLAVTDWRDAGGWHLFWWGAGLATAVEYVTHLFYERAFGVAFWNYRGVPGCLGGGRVCLPFSLVWGALSAAAAVVLQPLLEPLAAGMPPAVTYAALLLFVADGVSSASVLLHCRDTELLSLRAIRSKLGETGRTEPITQADGR